MAKVSVVIPCFNHGKFINDAIDSVLDQTFDDYEIIVVNDGSTDKYTNDLLDNAKWPKTRVITTKNQGLSSARNTGIAAATGKYILPLDSDDKIGPTYLARAVEILDNNDDVGIVYCMAEFFGTKSGPWNLPEYKFPDILSGNRIFCSALFRRESWQRVGGYKKDMIYGWEDFEFWLSLIEMGYQVYQIPQVLFWYRQHNVSMITQMDSHQYKTDHAWRVIFNSHREMYQKNIDALTPPIRNKFMIFCRGPLSWPKRLLFRISHSKKTFNTYKVLCA